jgi:hypothetical protein
MQLLRICWIHHNYILYVLSVQRPKRCRYKERDRNCIMANGNLLLDFGLLHRILKVLVKRDLCSFGFALILAGCRWQKAIIVRLGPSSTRFTDVKGSVHSRNWTFLCAAVRHA